MRDKDLKLSCFVMIIHVENSIHSNILTQTYLMYTYLLIHIKFTIVNNLFSEVLHFW